MKRSIILTINAIVFLVTCCTTNTNGPSTEPNVVERFYNNVQIISQNPDSDESYLAKEECIEMCKVSDASWNFPNEFKWMGLIDREERNVSPISYMTLLRKFSYKNKVKFSYKVEDSFKYNDSEPDSTSFYYYIVAKKYELNNYNCSFKDTVLVSPDTLIVGIKNISGGRAFTASETKTTDIDIIVK